MWMLVMFDLPVVQKNERKAAADFRHTLLDIGFEMSQFSVYFVFAVARLKSTRIASAWRLHCHQAGK